MRRETRDGGKGNFEKELICVIYMYQSHVDWYMHKHANEKFIYYICITYIKLNETRNHWPKTYWDVDKK